MQKRRCVFRDNPDPNDPEFFEKVMSVIQRLGSNGAELILMSDESSEVTQLHQITWQSANEELQTELSIVRDLHNEVCYATISSKQAWIVKEAETAFRETIDCYTIGELVDTCHGRFYDAQLLIALGLLARKPDADIIRTLSEALDHDLPRTRCCAARAIAFTQWSVFIPDLEIMLKMEDDPTARDMGERALEICERR